MVKHTHDTARWQVESWYQEYSKLVASHIKKKINADHETVEDLTQNVFERALRYLKNPAVPSIEAPRPWLIKIADNECSRLLKKEKQLAIIYIDSLRDADDDHSSSPIDWLEDKQTQTESLFEQRELVAVMNEKIATLPPAVQQAVNLHYTQGLSYDEIAALSGRASRKEGKDARKGMEMLRKCLLDSIDS